MAKHNSDSVLLGHSWVRPADILCQRVSAGLCGSPKQQKLATISQRSGKLSGKPHSRPGSEWHRQQTSRTRRLCAVLSLSMCLDYEAGGVTTDGDVLTLQQYVPTGNGTYNRASPRVYLLDPNGEDYANVQLTNQELSFDVDLSRISYPRGGRARTDH